MTHLGRWYASDTIDITIGTKHSGYCFSDSTHLSMTYFIKTDTNPFITDDADNTTQQQQNYEV